MEVHTNGTHPKTTKNGHLLAWPHLSLEPQEAGLEALEARKTFLLKIWKLQKTIDFERKKKKLRWQWKQTTIWILMYLGDFFRSGIRIWGVILITNPSKSTERSECKNHKGIIVTVPWWLVPNPLKKHESNWMISPKIGMNFQNFCWNHHHIMIYHDISWGGQDNYRDVPSSLECLEMFLEVSNAKIWAWRTFPVYIDGT